MSGEVAFEEINEAKANMDHVYDQPDPRAYFRELERLGYAIPGHAKPIFLKLIAHLRRRPDETVHVLDLGCSYGVNAALLKHDLSMPDLYEHWGAQALTDVTPEELAERDRDFFDNLDDPEAIEMIGLDQAESAVAFAEGAGLLDGGLALNLENEPLPGQVREELTQVDLVTSTGCVGYVTEKSFDRILPAITQGQPAWLGNFVLRLFPFDAIADRLSEWGYVTEKLEGRTFVQRRFESEEEQEQVIEQLREQGVDPTGLEAEGHLLAEFYLSRPASPTNIPIERLLAA